MRLAMLAASMCVAMIVGIGAHAADLPLPPTTPQAAGFSPERLGQIDAFFAHEIAANRVPGAVVGIARDGKLVYLKAFGYRDRERDAPMQVDTIFALASMTKPMVAVGALALTEQGKLPLFSPLASYFPAVAAMKVATPGPDGTLQYEKQAHRQGTTDHHARGGDPLRVRRRVLDRYRARLPALRADAAEWR